MKPIKNINATLYEFTFNIDGQDINMYQWHITNKEQEERLNNMQSKIKINGKTYTVKSLTGAQFGENYQYILETVEPIPDLPQYKVTDTIKLQYLQTLPGYTELWLTDERTEELFDTVTFKNFKAGWEACKSSNKTIAGCKINVGDAVYRDSTGKFSKSTKG